MIDVRNGGTSPSSSSKFLRRVGYDKSRWGTPEPYPSDAPAGPMVAITNEHAGSDGDIFSHCFKLFGLGPLIGKRTWGGVVGVWPRHALVDGTWTTQPEFAFWFQDVGWGVENYGTEPDIEVEVTPRDHAAGRDPQLERGVTEMLKLVRKMRPAIPEFTTVRSCASRPAEGAEENDRVAETTEAGIGRLTRGRGSGPLFSPWRCLARGGGRTARWARPPGRGLLSGGGRPTLIHSRAFALERRSSRGANRQFTSMIRSQYAVESRLTGRSRSAPETWRAWSRRARYGKPSRSSSPRTERRCASTRGRRA
jgi:hypothetical protein